ncbi:hypothetical protein VVD49_06225 [Uliginosibacterium sp. H3]|uniref:Secreted protein n=1 Tax=Uliginosibacterium silvisoli TaxID=3114758 RepID=A0ABU6K1B3_9RHOO|nr:hypothetical protein [Uliginosibacterium sp. H3]
MVATELLLALLATELLDEDLLDDELATELATLEEEDDLLEELLATELEEEVATLLELDELVVPAYEHQAEVVKVLDGKLLDEHTTLVVNVPYTKLPDLPSATERVPLNEQLAPVFCAHLV